MNLVFAHFGSPIPKHLALNLKRTSILFPDHKIYLVTDLILDKFEIANIIIYTYSHSKDWWQLRNNLKHEKNFRNNFWFTSSARFIALADFASFTNEDFLHIESDVIISEDFPFTKLSNSNYDLIFPIVSESNAIASCLYVRNSDSANYLSNFTLLESKKNNLTTDMYILSELSKKNNVKFAPLPTAPAINYSHTNLSTKFLHFSDILLKDFGGVFDGFDIGRYLFGDDPRNKRGVSILRDNDIRTYLDVRKLDLFVLPEREFPYIRQASSDSYIPLYSLHIHSKNPKLFKINKSKRIIHNYVAKSKEKSKKVFILSVFFTSAIKAIEIRIKNILIYRFIF
jgi:hypothetical protein